MLQAAKSTRYFCVCSSTYFSISCQVPSNYDYAKTSEADSPGLSVYYISILLTAFTKLKQILPLVIIAIFRACVS